MKGLPHYALIFFIGLTIFLGCAATNHNYFQDAKPAGKGNVRAEIGLSVGAAVDYEIADTLDQPPVIDIGSDIKLSPLLSFQVAEGVTENIDIGLGLGFGLVSVNFRIFSKFSLLGRNSKFGIALLPAANFSFVPDTILGFSSSDSRKILNGNVCLSLPVSYEIIRNITLVARPMYGYEWSRISVTDDDNPEDEFSKSESFRGRGLSFGIKIGAKGNDSFIFPEVCFISYDKGVHYIPFFGISLSISKVK